MSLSDTARRIRGFLDAASREQAEEEGNRRVYVYQVDDLAGIYYDDINGPDVRGWGGIAVGAVAAQNSFVQLFNPAGSGIDVVVEQVLLFSSATDNVDVRAHTTAIGASGTAEPRDFRRSLTVGADLRSGTSAAVGGTLRGRVAVAANVPLPIPNFDFCLGPQNGLTFSGQTVNLGFLCAIWWRERIPSRRDRA